jgi:hypothetical protein
MFCAAGYDDWEKVRPIGTNGFNLVKENIRSNIDKWEEEIVRYNESIEVVKSLKDDSSLGDKLAFIDEYRRVIEDDKEIIECLEYCGNFVNFLEDMVEEIESHQDCYNSALEIDINNYIYVGIEVGYPTIEDIVE